MDRSPSCPSRCGSPPAAVAALVCLSALLLGCPAAPVGDSPARDSSPDQSPNSAELFHQLTDVVDLEGRPVNPFEASGAKAVVLLFAKTDCPISNRYAPEVARLDKLFRPRGVLFFLVYPDGDEPVAAIREHLSQYGYTCPALRDPRHQLVRLSGARQTPEAAVFLPDGRRVYLGRIDDRFPDFGKVRSQATRHDLQEALEAVLAGRVVEPSTTPPGGGCYIADMK